MTAPGGVFCTFDVVSSATPELHDRAQAALGFDHVDCFWKWLELAVLAGAKPNDSR